MQESKALQTRVEQILAIEHSKVVLDLSACDYLDSTFLGCIAILYRQFGQSPEPRFLVFATRSHCQSLFGPTHLDLVLTFADSLPDTTGDYEDVVIVDNTAPSLGHHVMHCHQRLAEIDGPHQQSFARIAERLKHELEDQ